MSARTVCTARIPRYFAPRQTVDLPRRYVESEPRRHFVLYERELPAPSNPPRRVHYVPLEMPPPEAVYARASTNGYRNERTCKVHHDRNWPRLDNEEQVNSLERRADAAASKYASAHEQRAMLSAEHNYRSQRRVAPTVAAPTIRFVHVQGDDVVVQLTGARNYELELKTRRADLIIDAHHADCISMTPFRAHLHLPHAEGRLLGVRARARPAAGAMEPSRRRPASAGGYSVSYEPWAGASGSDAEGTEYEWSPWHTMGEGRFKDTGSSGYTAPHCWRDGTPHYWSGGAPWRAEVYGGDEPVGDLEDTGAVTPGPGTYGIPRFLQFGGGTADGRGFDYTPSSSFASNTPQRAGGSRKQAQDLWRTAPSPDQAAAPRPGPGAGYRTFSFQKEAF